jgi:hypothetical protein
LGEPCDRLLDVFVGEAASGAASHVLGRSSANESGGREREAPAVVVLADRVAGRHRGQVVVRDLLGDTPCAPRVVLLVAQALHAELFARVAQVLQRLTGRPVDAARPRGDLAVRREAGRDQDAGPVAETRAVGLLAEVTRRADAVGDLVALPGGVLPVCRWMSELLGALADVLEQLLVGAA